MSAAVEVAAPVERAYALLTSPDWPAALAADLADGSRFVSADPTPEGGVALVLSRSLPAGIPGFLRRFTPKDGRVTQTDRWGPDTGADRRGTWSVSYPGSPARVEGEMALEPSATGCRWTVSGTVRVQVPLVGGRAEGFLAPLIEKLVVRQGEVLAARLG